MVESLTDSATSPFPVFCNWSSMNVRTSARAIVSHFHFCETVRPASLAKVNALYWLVNLIMQVMWYFASRATKSPSDNFANSCTSPISVAAVRILISRPKDAALRRKCFSKSLALLCGSCEGFVSSNVPGKSQKKQLELPRGRFEENDVLVNFAGVAWSARSHVLSWDSSALFNWTRILPEHSFYATSLG